MRRGAQCALVLRGETTWERLRREQLNAAAQLPPDARPYDRGPLRNLRIFVGCEADPGHPVGAVPVAPASDAWQGPR